MVMSLRYYHGAAWSDGATHGQQPTGVGSNGVIKVVSLFSHILMSCFLFVSLMTSEEIYEYTCIIV